MWENRFWSHHVHLRFKERLYYFFIQVRSFDAERVESEVKKVTRKCALGSIRCYPVFGQHDVIVRIWMPPSLADDFQKELEKSDLAIRTIRQFYVKKINYLWYDSPPKEDPNARRELLRRINEKNIGSIEQGKQDGLLEDLIDEGLVREVPNYGNAIKFFVTVDLTGDDINLKDEIADRAVSFCYTKKGYSRIACYTGVGDDCAVLVKAQAESFFDISELPLFIARKFPRARTETFISLVPDFLFGEGRIGNAVVRAMQNQSIAVANIIPEVYGEHGKDQDRRIRAREIVSYVDSELGEVDLTDKKYDLIHEYLAGYLDGTISSMARVLFDFFVPLEGYLRNNLLSFVGRSCGKESNQVWSRVGIDRSTVKFTDDVDDDNPGNAGRKFLTLGDLLRLYEAAAEIAPESDADDAKIANWQALVRLRNKVSHGSFTTSGGRWKEPMELILNSYREISRLIWAIEQATSSKFDERFL